METKAATDVFLALREFVHVNFGPTRVQIVLISTTIPGGNSCWLPRSCCVGSNAIFHDSGLWKVMLAYTTVLCLKSCCLPWVSCVRCARLYEFGLWEVLMMWLSDCFLWEFMVLPLLRVLGDLCDCFFVLPLCFFFTWNQIQGITSKYIPHFSVRYSEREFLDEREHTSSAKVKCKLFYFDKKVYNEPLETTIS